MKKAQYYLLAVLVFCTFIFVALSMQGRTMGKAETGRFDDLSENFYQEGIVVVNRAVNQDENIFSSFATYSSDFKKYAEDIDKSFGYVYFVTDFENTNVVNVLDFSVQLKNNGIATELESNESLVIDSEQASIIIDENEYIFNLTDKPGLNVLYYEHIDDTIRVKQK